MKYSLESFPGCFLMHPNGTWQNPGLLLGKIVFLDIKRFSYYQIGHRSCSGVIPCFSFFSLLTQCVHLHKQSREWINTEPSYPPLDELKKLLGPICHSYIFFFLLKSLVKLGNIPRWKSLKLNLYAYATSCFSKSF